MTPERSGQDRRDGWGPECGKHDDLVVNLTRVVTTVRVWGTILSVVWAIGVGIMGWSANNFMGLRVATELSAADRKVIHEEIKQLEVRVEKLEQCRIPLDPMP